jgi:hypothetical protein
VDKLPRESEEFRVQKYLVSKFTRENYYHCFYYTKDYINFESPEMGQYFMKSKVFFECLSLHAY